MTKIDHRKVLEVLKSRDGLLTKVELADGQTFDVWNIAWGYDIGEEFAHVTTNCSPPKNERPIEFFYTNEVIKIIDIDDGYEIVSFK